MTSVEVRALSAELEQKLSPSAKKVLEKRYLKRSKDGTPLEGAADMFARVAENIAQADLLYDPDTSLDETIAEFFAVMACLEFLPNTPTLMNAGRELQQLSACFVLPVEDSMPSIFGAIRDAALVHQSGGGTGFSFSRLRPKNDLVRSTMGVASGPVSFMRVFDMATETIKQGGTRRGANMGILRVDHPDIIEFIRAKEDEHILNNFNISVGVTEEFMGAVLAGDDYALRNPRDHTEVGRLKATDVFDLIVSLAWKNGEPGIVFLDRLNRDNPTPNAGEIESTNPCGEQPLLPYESCNLGSINLSLMTADGAVDWARLGRVTRTAVHFLDNVIDMNRYPLPEIGDMTKSNRKIGLGVMGWADMLVELGMAYNSDEAIRLAHEVMGFIHEEAVAVSEQLALERGVFPNWEGSTWAAKGRRVRNATLTTIAPTGTISIIAGCSSGVEPIFALAYIRNVMDNTELSEAHPVFERVLKERGLYSEELTKSVAAVGGLHELDVPDDLKRVFVTAHDVSPEWHIRMQAAFQDHVDNAVSKTVNFPNQARPEDVERVYLLAYELGVKGVTIYRDGSRQEQVLNIGEVKRKGAAAGAQMELGDQGQASLPVRPSRSPVLRGETREKVTGCGSLYVTVNEDDFGPREVFANMGKAGGCASASTEAIGRLISLAFRYGVPPDKIVKQLRGIRCHVPIGFGPNQILSCPDAIGKALADKYHLAVGDGNRAVGQLEMPIAFAQGACPDCGGAVEHEGGCMVCRACGYSKCS
ncbi:MAG: vitamin B12-dependent ribonucleotide reductase [Thermoleophilia bacterium]|jgi:ribonucleoside-diphosphate reductase alpha chain